MAAVAAVAVTTPISFLWHNVVGVVVVVAVGTVLGRGQAGEGTRRSVSRGRAAESAVPDSAPRLS